MHPEGGKILLNSVSELPNSDHIAIVRMIQFGLENPIDLNLIGSVHSDAAIPYLVELLQERVLEDEELSNEVGKTLSAFAINSPHETRKYLEDAPDHPDTFRISGLYYNQWIAMIRLLYEKFL
jgi:hypothetical protein